MASGVYPRRRRWEVFAAVRVFDFFDALVFLDAFTAIGLFAVDDLFGPCDPFDPLGSE